MPLDAITSYPGRVKPLFAPANVPGIKALLEIAICRSAKSWRPDLSSPWPRQRRDGTGRHMSVGVALLLCNIGEARELANELDALIRRKEIEMGMQAEA